jgi:hypothetical protein
LETVDCFGEACIGSFGCLEFLPGDAQRLSLIGRKYPKELIRRHSLTVWLVECTLRVEQRRVPAFDLHDIVKQQHLDDSPYVDRTDRIFP